MKKLIVLLLLMCGMTWADFEKIEPDATSTPNAWDSTSGISKVTSVTDAVDDNYISETIDEDKQRFTMANPTGIDGGDTIDSVVTYMRAKDSGTGNNKVQMHQYVDANSNDGTNEALSTSYVDYTDAFALAPDGGAWTLTDVNDLQLEAHCTAIGALKTVYVTKIYATVWFTPAAGAVYSGKFPRGIGRGIGR